VFLQVSGNELVNNFRNASIGTTVTSRTQRSYFTVQGKIAKMQLQPGQGTWREFFALIFNLICAWYYSEIIAKLSPQYLFIISPIYKQTNSIHNLRILQLIGIILHAWVGVLWCGRWAQIKLILSNRIFSSKSIKSNLILGLYETFLDNSWDNPILAVDHYTFLRWSSFRQKWWPSDIHPGEFNFQKTPGSGN
jgi:hypothetical protein